MVGGQDFGVGFGAVLICEKVVGFIDWRCDFSSRDVAEVEGIADKRRFGGVEGANAESLGDECVDVFFGDSVSGIEFAIDNSLGEAAGFGDEPRDGAGDGDEESEWS